MHIHTLFCDRRRRIQYQHLTKIVASILVKSDYLLQNVWFLISFSHKLDNFSFKMCQIHIHMRVCDLTEQKHLVSQRPGGTLVMNLRTTTNHEQTIINFVIQLVVLPLIDKTHIISNLNLRMSIR